MMVPLSAEEISYQSERVTHLHPNDVYYAHLSIYHFASQFCKNKSVLDAGSGSGYGSAYLAEQGARQVTAFDIEEKAVEFSRYYFSKPNLSYQVMNIERITGFPRANFGVIFSSNALEHVPNVYPFFYSAWELLKLDGHIIIAVPPVVDELSRQSNLGNPFHLNIWTPHQWYYVLSLYFDEVQPYIHEFNKPGIQLDFDEFYNRHTLTVIFVAKNPKNEKDLPGDDSILKFVDDSFTRSPQNFKSQSKTEVSAKYELRRLIARSKEVVHQNGIKVLLLHLQNYSKSKIRNKN
jgi:SAM-dependent methyltransferase